MGSAVPPARRAYAWRSSRSAGTIYSHIANRKALQAEARERRRPSTSLRSGGSSSSSTLVAESLDGRLIRAMAWATPD